MLNLYFMDFKQTKQEFLRTSIIDKGYDPNLFVQFISQFKKQSNSTLKGFNLDNWTLQELRKVVNSFVIAQLENQLNNKQSQLEKSQQLRNSLINEQIKIKLKNYPVKPLQKDIKCITLVTKFPIKKYIQIYISEQRTLTSPVRVNQSSFLGSSYLMFKITIPEYNFEVRRRYSDFQWLKEILIKKFPGYILPALPPKQASKRTERELKKRMTILGLFLKSLWSTKEIFYSKECMLFLSEYDYEYFLNQKQLIQNAPKSLNKNQITNISGVVHLEISKKTKRFSENIEHYIEEAPPLLKNLNIDFKKLYQNLKQSVSSLFTISNDLSELYKNLQALNKHLDNSKEIQHLSDMYALLNNFTVQWGNRIQEQMQLIDTYCSTFFKYQRHDIASLNQLFKTYQQKQETFITESKNLEKKKEKLFENGNPKSWQIEKKQLKRMSKEILGHKQSAMQMMLPKETTQLESLRQNLAFYSSSLYYGGMKSFHENAEKMSNNFNQFWIKQKCIYLKVTSAYSSTKESQKSFPFSQEITLKPKSI